MGDIGSSGRKRQRVKGSKNRNKKAWRKLGDGSKKKRPVHELSDDELFEIDTTPFIEPIVIKEESLDRFPQLADIKSDVNAKGGLNWRNLKCLSSLSAVGNLDATAPHQTEAMKQRSRYLKKLALKAARTLEQKAEVLKKKAESEKEKQRLARRGDPVFNRDLWASPTLDGEKPSITFLKSYTAPSKLPPSLRSKAKSGVAAVELPHPGMSYNPSEKDHEDLLRIATDKALLKAADDKKLEVFQKMKSKSARVAEEVWAEEMQQGLEDDNAAEIKEEDDWEEEAVDVRAAVTASERKTKKQRKREAEQKAQKDKKTQLKAKKVKEHGVFSAKNLLKELKKREEEIKIAKEKRKAKLEDPKRIKRLGKVKFEEPDPEVKLKEELTDNLRTLRPEGNLLFERYKSLQKRNILEPRKRQKLKRKYKLKTYQLEDRKIPELKSSFRKLLLKETVDETK